MTRLDSVFFKAITKDTVTFKIGAEGANWREVTLPFQEVNEYIKNGTLWKRLEELVDEVSLSNTELNPDGLKCPVCNSHKSTFLRGFKSWWFCGFCGAHLYLDKAHKVLTIKAKR